MEKTVKDFDQDPRDRKESEERWATVRRHQRFLAAGWVLLVFAFIGGTRYAYPALGRHDAVIAQFAGVHQTGDAIGAQLQQIAATLREGEESNRRDAGAIEHQLAAHCVNCEVAKNRSAELAEGISLGITSTDVAHRYVSGWMWVMPDRRTIWLKSQNAGQPVIFYGYTDGKKRELVITSVARGSATGYLLLPGESGESKQMSAVQNRGK